MANYFDDDEGKDMEDDGNIRKFDSGATRDTSTDKLDFEGFLCPLVIERYAEYMNMNREQTDGSLRDSDNWQKGIPKKVYMKSMWRHFFAVWSSWRSKRTVVSEVDLCGLLFNVMGMLHEIRKEQVDEEVEKSISADSSDPYDGQYCRHSATPLGVCDCKDCQGRRNAG
jgi:hypothetical protein